ncbi:MAG: ribosome maturation factor RimM, partial [Dongiaceae bacterium]
LTVTGAIKGGVIARVAGVADRAAAEGLRGLKLYVARTALPAPADGEFYRADLIGLSAELADGARYGRVADVQNWGAGDVLEIELPDGRTELLPFTRTVVPQIDVAAGRLVVEPPVLVEVEPEQAGSRG